MKSTEGNKMNVMKKIVAVSALVLSSATAMASDYKIDVEGAHAFIEFRIKHLGYSWLHGRFNTFDGEFSYDENNPSASKVNVTIQTASVDSNHAERDKHLRNKDFLEVDKYPQATFVSKSFTEAEDGTAVLTGDFTLHGVTKTIDIDVVHVGHGPDPWGGYRRGFEGNTTIALKDFGITKYLGPASTHVDLRLSVEGIRQGKNSGGMKR